MIKPDNGCCQSLGSMNELSGRQLCVQLVDRRGKQNKSTLHEHRNAVTLQLLIESALDHPI